MIDVLARVRARIRVAFDGVGYRFTDRDELYARPILWINSEGVICAIGEDERPAAHLSRVDVASERGVLGTASDAAGKYAPLFLRYGFAVAMGTGPFRNGWLVGPVVTYAEVEATLAASGSARLFRVEAFVEAARMAGAKTVLLAPPY